MAGRSGRWLVHTEAIGTGKNRAIYYYTNIVLTGSHIPAVLRRYKGTIEIVSGAPANTRSFSIGDLGSTGSDSVAGELVGLDPAISSGGHR